MRTVEDLLRRQEELQAEAEKVALDLELGERLSVAGDPIRVGSSALGLMVHRDLDITVVCPALDTVLLETVAQIGARLAIHTRVRQVEFRDDTGHWNTDPKYPDGLYLGVEYRTTQENDWTLDIWFVDEPERMPDLAHLKALPPRLTPESRAAILKIKNEWFRRTEYGTSIYSHDIYRAVLDDGVRTCEQFDQWRQRQSGPVQHH